MPDHRTWRWKPTIALVVGLSGAVSATDIAAGELNFPIIYVNEQGPTGQHMIFRRIEEHKFEEVAAYLDAGVDIDIRGFRRSTPVTWAAQAGLWDMVLFLAERDADLGVEDKDGISVCSVQEPLATRPDLELGRALEEVRIILKDRGLC